MTKFAVVLFPDEEDCIDVISSSWVLPSMTPDQKGGEKICRYPPHSIRGAKLAKLVISHVQPSSTWLVCSCRVLCEFDDYLKAREASIRAEETSNLESSAVEEADVRRLRRQKALKSQKKTSTKLANTHETPSTSLGIEKDNPINLTNIDEFKIVAVAQQSEAINQAKSPQHFESEGGGGFVLETNQLTPEPPMPSGELPSAETIITLLKEYQAKNERFQEAVIDRLIHISHKLKSLNLGPSSTPNFSLEGAPPLPLTCKEDLHALNIWLLLGKNQESMVTFLSLHGGDSVSSVTASVMKEIFTNQFAITVSYTGKGGKAVCGIKGSLLHKIAIIRGVRSNRGYENSTEFEIKEAIKNWLRNAGDRCGGREARRHHNV
ncbi:hypothetical protein Fcan01_12295 [Folsomia candida]|uniref:DUF4806 domain-containing protein n=1 Tax=Folsomia candida TaxID=158441 RepID=A0A226E4T0_FOLCA|nr:hypothetical protein Fcan01_12295 [Folsomia candida]